MEDYDKLKADYDRMKNANGSAELAALRASLASAIAERDSQYKAVCDRVNEANAESESHRLAKAQCVFERDALRSECERLKGELGLANAVVEAARGYAEYARGVDLLDHLDGKCTCPACDVVRSSEALDTHRAALAGNGETK